MSAGARRLGVGGCVAWALMSGAAQLLYSPRWASAQSANQSPVPLVVTTRTSLDAYRDGRRDIELSLSRVLEADDGDVVILAGTMDVTALSSRTDTILSIKPGAFPLPSGESQLTVMAKAGGRWTTIASFPLRILAAGGFVRASAAPTVNVSSTGQIADGRSAGLPSPTRNRSQDVTLAAGVRSTLERPGFTLESQSNLVGASRDELALRFAQRGDDAPLVDLSDYLMSLRLPRGKLELGHVALGANRHLVSGFASRGVSFTAGPAWASLTLGSVAGAPIVGWDNLVGFAEQNHRISSASLSVELVRSRPGAVEVRLTTMDGSRLPQAGFAQGAITDAEESRGTGFEVTAATPGQRARLSAGYSRSTFDNPVTDSQLVGGLPVTRVERERRGARYLESSLGLLQGARLFGRTNASMTLGWRHEQVDPLYRSVGVATQADRTQNVFDVNGVVGLLSLQGAVTRARDNLANLASVLTSRTDGYTANVAAPLAPLLRVRKRASWLPQLTLGYVSLHQFALGAPASNDFRPQDLTDQMSTSLDVAAQWQIDGWQISVRDNRSRQDNRQFGRERADFSGSARNASFGRSFGARLDGSLDLNLERLRNAELDQVNRVRRLGLTTNWRVSASTTVSSNVTAAVSRTPPSTSDVTNIETRAELARTIRLLGRGAGARTGQVFLRFARTSITAVPFDAGDGSPLGLTTQIQWTLNSGLSLRVW